MRGLGTCARRPGRGGVSCPASGLAQLPVPDRCSGFGPVRNEAPFGGSGDGPDGGA